MARVTLHEFVTRRKIYYTGRCSKHSNTIMGNDEIQNSKDFRCVIVCIPIHAFRHRMKIFTTIILIK